MDVQSDAQHTPEVPPPDGETTHGSGGPSVTDWLLTATQSRARARLEWQQHGVTMLQTGRAFSAVRMSARLVRAAAGTCDFEAVDRYLARALVGGPVIHDPYRCRYYALVAADSDRPWTAVRDVEPFGVGGYVGVPRPGRDAPDGSTASYWSAPMRAAGVLCSASAVTALIELGRYELAAQAPAEGEPVSPLPVKGRR